MKTYICPDYLKTLLFETLLKDNAGTAGIAIKNLQTCFYPETERENNTVTLIKAKNILLPLKDQLPIYGEMLKYPAFLQQLISFVKEMGLYNVTINELKKDSVQRKELVIMLEQLLSLNLPEFTIGKLTLPENLDNYELLEGDYGSYFNRQLVKQYSSKKPLISLIKKTPKEISFKSALNIRQEVEAIAQYICSNQIQRDSLLVLADPADLPVVMQVFDRYGIPTGLWTARELLKMPQRMQKLIDFHLHKDVNHLVACIQCGAFSASTNLVSFIQRFMKDDNLLGSIELSFDTELELVRSVEQKALLRTKEEYDRFLTNNKSLLNLLTGDLNKDTIVACYKHLIEQPEAKEEEKTLLSIRSTLESVYPYLEDSNDYEILSYQLSSMMATSTDLSGNYCAVTDLSHPVNARKYTFVIGCTSKVYPGFTPLSGLFDENYVEGTSYPSMQDRYNAYIDQLSWIRQSASEHLFYSFHSTDFSGKGFEIPFELEEEFKYPTPWELIENDVITYKHPSLTEETANALFFDKNILTGSISRFEKYFNCPYAYYLQYGLKINEDHPAALDAAMIGTIQHALMENSVNKYGKDYGGITRDDIKTLVHPYFEQLFVLYPLLETKLRISEERVINVLKDSIEYLAEMEKATSYVPEARELKVEYLLELPNRKIKFNGIVDRLDVCGNNFRIIDYKSSKHDMKAEDIKAGLRLQLLTYMMIIQALQNRIPEAVLYFSFKKDNQTVKAGKFNRQSIFEGYSDEEDYDLYANGRRLVGLRFMDSDSLDYDKKFTNTGKTCMDPDELLALLKELYIYLIDHLKLGEIKVEPIEGGCTFCTFRSICRFKGEQKKKKPIVNLGGETDGME